MFTHINFEVFSPAMKAKLDMKYRRRLQANQQPGSNEFWRRVNQSSQKTALPFTTITRAYGTYPWRSQ
jgi:hypothetical protein